MAEQIPYSQVPLNPVAELTNQFHYPEVRRSLDGSMLAQVATALTQVDSRVQPVVDQLQAEEIQKQQQLGAQEFAQLKEQNLQGFQDAVKNGLISYEKTPFAYEYVQKAVGQAIATQAVNQTRAAYQQNPALHVDSIQPYSDFIDQQRQQALQQADGPLMAGEIGQVFDQAKPQLINEHISIMDAQRPEQMVAAFQTNGMNSFAGIDPHTTLVANGPAGLSPSSADTESSLAAESAPVSTSAGSDNEQSMLEATSPSSVPTGQSSDVVPPGSTPQAVSPQFDQEQGYAGQAFKTAVASLQQQMDQLGQQSTMPWPRVNAATTDLIASLMIQKRDPGLGMAIASQLKTKDGFSLWDHLDSRTAIMEASRQVNAQIIQDQQRQEESIAIQQEQAKRAAYADAMSKWNAAGRPADVPLASYFDQKLLTDPTQSQGAIEALTELNSTFAQLQAAKDAPTSTQDYLTSTAKSAHESMGTDLASTQKFATILDTLTAQGHGQLASQLAEDRKAAWYEAGGVTDQRVKGNLVTALGHGTLTEQMIDTAWQNHQLSTEDYNQFLGELHRNDSSMTQLLGDVEAKITDQVQAEFQAPNRSVLLSMPGAASELQQRIADAKVAFYNQATALRNDPTIPIGQQALRLSQLVDPVVKSFAKPVTPAASNVPAVTPVSPALSPLAQRDTTIKASSQFYTNADLVKMLGAPLSSLQVQPMGSWRRAYYDYEVPGFGTDANDANETPIGKDAQGQPVYGAWQAAGLNQSSKREFLLGKLQALRQQSTPDYDAENEVASQLASHFNRQRLLDIEANAPQVLHDAIRSYQLGTLTPQQQTAARKVVTAQQILSQIDTVLPHPLNEAVQSPESWKEVPLFATPKQLAENEAAVMPRFNLNPQDVTQRQQFEDTQMKLIQQMRTGSLTLSH